MTKFRNILLALHGKDNEEKAIRRAFALAKNNKAKLTVVDVLEELPIKMKDLLKIVSVQELEEAAIKERLSDIKGLIKSAEAKTRIKAETKVLVGKPQIEIIKEVLRNNNDLVMKTPEGKGTRRLTLFGTIDINLMRKCPCPVWMVKPSKSIKYSRILAAVDPDPFERVRNELNKEIMELAVSISQSEKSELHIVHAWRLWGESALRGLRVRASEAEMNRLLQATRNFHKRWLDNLLAEFPLANLEHKVHLRKGDPGILIPDIAKKERIDLIVMGTVCRTGIPGLIIGNTAESVLNQVDCSLLTVKPYRFISPIKA